MTLSTFVGTPDTSDQTLVVANRKLINEPMVQVIETVFDDQPVSVEIGDLSGYPTDHLVLRRDEEIVASSPINEFLDSILLRETGDFLGGQLPLSEVTIPDVIEALEGTTFSVSDQRLTAGKELFVAISRYVEKLAFEHGRGTLRAGFQELSRMRDERGTAEVYKTLGNTDLDVHVYGEPDWVPPTEFGVVIHGGDDEAFTRNWFVVYEPPEGAEVDGMAFLSTEVEPGNWEGFWSRDPALIEELSDHIARTM